MYAKRDYELMLKARLKEGTPLFFSRKSFFHSLNDKCQTAEPGGPSTPHPWGPRQLRTSA